MKVSAFDSLIPCPESATGYHVSVSQNPIVCDAQGLPKDTILTVTVYRKTGTNKMELAKGVYISVGVFFPDTRLFKSDTGEIAVSLVDNSSTIPKYVQRVQLWIGESGYGDYNISSMVINIALDGQKGDAGINRLPVPYGEYSSEVTYTATDLIAPYVLLAGKYYVMNKTTSVKGLNPQADYAANGTKATWIYMEHFKAAFVEILMANLGLIGKAVFYGEYQYSQYGKKGSAEVSESGKYDVPIDAGGTFGPNLLLNFLTGYIRCYNVDIRGIIRAISGNIGGWNITDEGIESEELTQSSGGITGRNRTVLKKDGTISGNLLNVSLNSGWLRCLLYDSPILEWTDRLLKAHAFFATPFELTSAIIQGSGTWAADVLYGKLLTNNLIVEPTTDTVYYALPIDLEKYNGVTLRIYNPATRGSSWRAASAYLVYSLSQSDTHYDTSKVSLTNFLGKFTGTTLSLPVGKMVVITGVREQVPGGSFGNDRLRWYVEVTA